MMRGAFDKRSAGGSSGAMQALSRLLEISSHASQPSVVERALVREARALFDVSAVLLLRVEDGTVTVAAGDPEPGGHVRLDQPAAVRRVLEEAAPVRLAGSAAGDLLRAGSFATEPDVLLLLPAGAPPRPRPPPAPPRP